MAEHPLHPVNRQHLDGLTGPLGIWQHAAGPMPDQAFGYCTDDVARALIVDLLHRRELGWTAVRPTARRSLRFLFDAFDPALGTFRNFRAADGSWLDAGGSEDSQGRALLALGLTLAETTDHAMAARARALFAAALPAVGRLTALRASASALLGCSAALEAGASGETQRVFDALAARLRLAFAPTRLNRDWPWPEPVLTYENGLLPHAIIVAAVRFHDDDLLRAGLRALDWLIREQTSTGGRWSPIGCSGWWRRGGVRSRFDQQPIEATSMILAAETALGVTGDARYRRVVEAAYGWFLGDNDVGAALADPTTGGCHDGLTPGGANLNQGAESTLMWQIALEHVRRIRGTGAIVQPQLAQRRALAQPRELALAIGR